MKRVYTNIWLSFAALLVLSSCAEPSILNRETSLDGRISISDSTITSLPTLPPLCDSLKLQKEMIDIGNCSLYTEQEGKGVAVVLLHGGPGSTHHQFHPWFSSAASFARIIYFDQRGCGFSEYKPGSGYSVRQAINDLEILRKKFGISEWVILGHSYGGFLAQCYALEYPQNVKGLVLVSALHGIPDTALSAGKQNTILSAQEKEAIDRHGQKLVAMRESEGWSFEELMALYMYNKVLNGDWKRQSFHKPSDHEAARYAMYEWKHDFDGKFNQVISDDLGSIDLTGRFNTLNMPTLIIEGLWDITWSEAKPVILHRNHPNAKMVMFPASGHSPFIDEPAMFMDELRRFLDSLR